MRVYLLLLSFLLSTYAHSQWMHEELYSSPKLNTENANKFTIDADVIGFLKNNEYFSPIAKGETFPGIRFIPKVAYQIDDKFRFELGTSGVYYSGDQQKIGKRLFSQMHALMQYSVTPELNLMLGNYHGGVNHRLIEPLYRWEKHLVDKPESGVQMTYTDKKYFADVWLDWHRYIERGDTLPEVLTFGVSSSVILTPEDSQWKVSIPLQLIINHRGGQIDESDEKMVVLGNLASGVCSEYNVGKRFVKSIGLSLYAVGYYDKLPDKELRPYDFGWGLYPVVSVNANPFKFMAGYWRAKKFYSVDGEALFGSFNLHYPEEKLRTRSLLTLKASYSKQLHKMIAIGAQAETYTDMGRGGDTDYSFGLHLRFNLGGI